LLDVNVTTVYRLLKRDDWTDVRAAYEEEAATAGDFFLGGLMCVAAQSCDLQAKLKACMAGLRAHRPVEYGDNSKVTLEGGRNPIRTQNQTTTVDITMLQGLSIECQRELLEVIERSENPPTVA